MFLLNWIKRYGIGSAIDAMDNLEKPLGDQIENEKKKIAAMDSQALAKWIVDKVQDGLRKWFKIDPPLPPDNV